MPELPEVEVVVQTLKLQLINQTIIKTDVFYEPIVESAMEFKKIEGKKILDISRKGKYLIFILSDDLVIVGHLRMEGKFYLKKIDEPILKHEHFMLTLFNGITVRYHDFRKFGRFVVQNKHTYLKEQPLVKLANDPKDISFDDFYEKVIKRKTEIKKVLLDQTVIAGLGNIYVNEVLFASRIHPEKIAETLTKKEVKSILENAIMILEKAISLGGTTISTYESSLGVHGKFQNNLLVHGKEKQACPICQTTITKIKVGGRGTYVCTTCQKK
ncbi:Formamidopyrimidine-DNA glycosylase [Alteracholeplasma palmae J233]|uniref:Formamidopyrimidine-DNA glycosylase n=1 Tax=Alteracholeplasma palmae (strain ATCC 49389 / J233) TaxID=1318466 RepID=U4KKE0_ALTPJ|nr:DNA-formamidopyrimidine glycosylase [Alteracholeplasma palmae]CCV64057.1 Formamidopyrimidine-DNA glycosylase [Alteracholeplasma palmae J233]